MTMSPDSTRRNRKKFGHGSGHQILTGVTVRREKALDFSGYNSRPGTGSLHPVGSTVSHVIRKISTCGYAIQRRIQSE